MEQDGDAEALRALLDNLDQLTFVLDGQSRAILYANAAFLSFMRSASCEGMTVQEFIDADPEIKERRECFLKSTIGSIDPSRGVFCPGIGRWFKISVTPIKWKGQDATSYLAQDITEEKREEDIRYERNIAYDILTKRFNVSIWEYDKDTHTVSMVQKDAADTFGKMHQPDVIEDVPYSLVPNVDERDVDKFVRMYTSIDAGMKKADSKVMLINPITHESFFLHIILTTFTDYQGKERVVGCGIDISVVLPVVTTPHQYDSILRFASQINEENAGKKEHRLLSLGGIHPDCEDIPGKIAQLVREGFKGIKLHPHYQGVAFDDIRYLRILDEASAQGLFVLTHAGYDPVAPDHDYCSVDMIMNALSQITPYRLILAHLGSNCNYQESLDRLCGLNVYMDTGYSLSNIPDDLFVRMVHKHGADKILFATDCPWAHPDVFLRRIQDLTGLSQEEKELILYENASVLLGV